MKVLFGILRYFFLVLLLITGFATVGGILFFLQFSKDLPSIISIEDYKPDGVSRVLGKGDVVVGEFFEQIRYLVSLDKIPDHVIKAFVAAEDDRFFEHQGVDFIGILRATLVNLKAGHVVQGGSTITQQVAKSILLTSERSFTRKIKEVILSLRMEKNFTKKQIIYLYLNQIYFGEGCYGVEAASRVYFNKSAKDLSLAEASILAGLPQAPSRYSPLNNAKKAKERQQYVLHRMAENKFISKQQMDEALSASIKVYLPADLKNKYAPYYIEYIRKYLLEKYGKDVLYKKSLTIKTPIDPELSVAATKAVQVGLRAVDRRHGYRGPLERIKNAASATGRPDERLIEISDYNIEKKFPYRLILPDGSLAADYTKRFPEIKRPEDLLNRGEIYKALVTYVDDQKKEVGVTLGVIRGIISYEKMKWAFPAKQGVNTTSGILVQPSQILAKGDVILVKYSLEKVVGGQQLFELEQLPEVQGALLSLDNSTGEVLAMVGGYSFEDSEFNRAVQAERQPGSAYKAVIYSAAVDKGYTPATLIQDSPLVFSSGDNEKWKPLNYDEHFSGDTTFRVALIRSMNIPTIKIVQDIGIPYLLNFSNRIGISKGLNPDYSIALGSLSISLLDLTKVYAVFPRIGRKIKPIFITKVFDREGRVLEETPLNPPSPQLNTVLPPAPKPVTVAGQLTSEAHTRGTEAQAGWNPDPLDSERIMDQRTAYVMTHLMNEVATVGTGSEAKNLKRAAAGKTGTTNDYNDAWFMGFTPQVTTGVWVGFDTQKSLGTKGTGGQTALPIWVDYMHEAVKGYPDVPFTVPPGVTFAYINGTTGRLVSQTTPGAIREAFTEGTEPSRSNSNSQGGAHSTGPQQEDSHTEDFLKQDFN